MDGSFNLRFCLAPMLTHRAAIKRPYLARQYYHGILLLLRSRAPLGSATPARRPVAPRHASQLSAGVGTSTEPQLQPERGPSIRLPLAAARTPSISTTWPRTSPIWSSSHIRPGLGRTKHLPSAAQTNK